MSQAPQRVVLVVDPDPGAAAALGPALRREGYQVRIARDGARALQLAMVRVPDVMLVDESTPVVGPRTLVRILRSNPRTSGVPILYAGGEGAQLPEGASALLRKPLDTDEVLASIRGLAGGRAGAADARDPERLEGSLTQVPLPDVLQMLGNNRKTGQLIVSGEALRVEVAFHEGEVVDAAANGVTGEKALFRALALRDGRFVFRPGEPPAARRIERPLAELLLDGLRICDELAVLAPQLPARAALIARAGAVQDGDAGTWGEELHRVLDAPRSLGDLLDRAAESDLDVVQTVLRMLACGSLRVVEPPPEPSGETQPFLSQGEAHALLTRLRQGSGPGPAVGKVLLIGGDAEMRRAALERVSVFAEFRGGDGQAAFGTIGTLQLADLRIDLVLLPDDPVLFPLWGPLAAGALGALLLGSAAAVEKEAVQLVRIARFPLYRCGDPRSRDAATEPAAEDYRERDPADALRGVVMRSVARSRPS